VRGTLKQIRNPGVFAGRDIGETPSITRFMAEKWQNPQQSPLTPALSRRERGTSRIASKSSTTSLQQSSLRTAGRRAWGRRLGPYGLLKNADAVFHVRQSFERLRRFGISRSAQIKAARQRRPNDCSKEGAKQSTSALHDTSWVGSEDRA
jgi:hypothetical protein